MRRSPVSRTFLVGRQQVCKNKENLGLFCLEIWANAGKWVPWEYVILKDQGNEIVLDCLDFMYLQFTEVWMFRHPCISKQYPQPQKSSEISDEGLGAMVLRHYLMRIGLAIGQVVSLLTHCYPIYFGFVNELLFVQIPPQNLWQYLYIYRLCIEISIYIYMSISISPKNGRVLGEERREKGEGSVGRNMRTCTYTHSHTYSRTERQRKPFICQLILQMVAIAVSGPGRSQELRTSSQKR